MDKINLENIIKSFFLGIFIGIVLQFYENADMLFSYKVLVVLASGSVGFIIGFITEWLTSILPIRIANSKMYFFINNIIAWIVTTIMMASLIMITSTSSNIVTIKEFLPILVVVLSIICIANLMDYMMYRRAQSKLKAFKASIKDK